MTEARTQRIARWLYRPANHRLLWIASSVVLLLTVAVQWWVPAHGHFGFDDLLGFNAVFGFVSCAAMVVVAKLLGYWLKRPEDYYRHEDPATQDEGAEP
ncbi:MAG TPA: hypothetical protein VL027_02890 [Spongiibacteraceae bacterium]|jgi:hypothetical protein|nr:hypothetical protein [Spongiibacteraceae bacterium]HUH36871.1 hypothetical protein [Spongiibacteraceae bacterium]